MVEFKREHRYVVLKLKDLERLPVLLQETLWGFLNDAEFSLPQRQYVVVESDWPEYEAVFKMIEARVTGVPNEIERLTAALTERDVKLEEFDGEHSTAELRDMLDESFEEKQKCYFALGQQLKAVNNLIAERSELQAKLAAMETQEPVAEVLLMNGVKTIDASMAFFDKSPVGTKLYAAAGAAPPKILMNQLISDKVALQHKLDAALEKLAALESQPHCATLHDDGYWTWNGTPPHKSSFAGWRMNVYAAAGAAPVPTEPVLPYDVGICGNTFRKGVKLSTFIAAAKRWHREAYPESYDLTDAQRAENLNRLLAAAPKEAS